MIDWKNIGLEDLAAYLSEYLRQKGVNAVLVGGACVTIYSRNRYQTYDLDFVAYEDKKFIKAAMYELGFEIKSGSFRHKECPWLIEFVAPPIAVSSEPIKSFYEKKSSLGVIRMLRPEDSVKDRLASFFHWNDRQGLEQAVNICLDCPIDLKEVSRWAIKESQKEKYEFFLQKLLEAGFDQ